MGYLVQKKKIKEQSKNEKENIAKCSKLLIMQMSGIKVAKYGGHRLS